MRKLIRHPFTILILVSAGLIGGYFSPMLFAKLQLRKLGLDYTPDSFVNVSCRNDMAAVDLFITAGIDVRVATPSGLTALHCAASNGATDMVALLLAKKASVNAQNVDLQSPLHKAVGNSHEQVVRLLIDNGADVNLQSNSGPPIFRAAASGNNTMIQLLLDNGADVLATDKSGGTALNAAVEGVRFESTIRYLLTQGVSPNGRSRQGPALLQTADNAQISLLLLSKGADPNIAGSDGTTALHIAVQRNSLELIEALLAAGARIDVVSQQYGTPLHQAARTGNIAVAEMLIKRGADVNALDCCNHMTPLHLAVTMTNPQSLAMTTLLLSWGADPEARTSAGRTPLIEARNAPLHIVQELVLKGANVNARDNQGKSVLWWFRNRNNPASSYLISKGATI